MATISLCMIVKNEEPTLGRCLKSVEGIPDEIIVVDTGSTDQTKLIAAEFTSTVLDFWWADDFAAARNYSFSAATMDYIMWLDADDIVLPDQKIKLLALKNGLTSNIDAVSTEYHTSFDASGNVTSSARRLRLVKRSRSFTWAGVVHEDLEVNGAYQLLTSDIVITHWKQIATAGPSRRNLLILENHLQRNMGVRPVDIFNYARELQLHKEFEKAIRFYHQFLDSNTANVQLTLFALDKLATCYYMIGRLDKEWECTLRSLEIDVPRPEFSCRFGERFIAQNKYSQAIFWYELALRNPAGMESEGAVTNYPFSTWLPHKQLGLCYYRLGNYHKSLEHNKLARTYLPNDQEISANISMLEKIANS